MNRTVLISGTATGDACLDRLPGASLYGFLISFVFLLLSFTGKAQVTTTGNAQVTTTVNVGELRAMEEKYGSMSAQLAASTRRTLKQMQQKEMAVQRRIQATDSGKAAQVFGQAQQTYKSLLARLSSITGGGTVASGAPGAGASGPSPKLYFAAIDSVHTSMAFLNSMGSVPGISTAAMQKVSQLTAGTSALQQRMELAEEAQAFLRQREQEWTQGLSQYTKASQLLNVNKQVYYYQQQLDQYKNMLNNKDQLEEKALAAVQKMPACQQFWARHSAVAQLFPQQQVDGKPVPSALQTKDQVMQAVNHLSPRKEGGTNTAGGSGTAGGANTTMNVFQQQAEKGQQDLGSLKDKLNSLGIAGAGGSTSMTMPNFTPNSQHGKRLTDRTEFGFSLQTVGATTLMPATLQPAIYAGYRFSDKLTAGIGASYILGVGQSFKTVRLSNQGLGLRSYFDAQFKGSIWLTGGFEYNYVQNAWQRSALTGLMKKYKLGKKEGKLQLLYDWLHASENPKAPPIVFRTAYSF